MRGQKFLHLENIGPGLIPGETERILVEGDVVTNHPRHPLYSLFFGLFYNVFKLNFDRSFAINL
jgi:hypothetical protein